MSVGEERVLHRVHNTSVNGICRGELKVRLSTVLGTTEGNYLTETRRNCGQRILDLVSVPTSHKLVSSVLNGAICLVLKYLLSDDETTLEGSGGINLREAFVSIEDRCYSIIRGLRKCMLETDAGGVSLLEGRQSASGEQKVDRVLLLESLLLILEHIVDRLAKNVIVGSIRQSLSDVDYKSHYSVPP
jgi:hypothetical protein